MVRLLVPLAQAHISGSMQLPPLQKVHPSVPSTTLLTWLSAKKKQDVASQQGRGTSNKCAERTPRLADTASLRIGLGLRFSTAELICSILIHLPLLEWNGLTAAEITVLGQNIHLCVVAAMEFTSRLALFENSSLHPLLLFLSWQDLLEIDTEPGNFRKKTTRKELQVNCAQLHLERSHLFLSIFLH